MPTYLSVQQSPSSGFFFLKEIVFPPFLQALDSVLLFMVNYSIILVIDRT